MCWSPLDSKDAFDRFFSQNWVSKPVSNVWELLVVAPFNLVRTSFIMIVVRCRRSVLQCFLEVEFLGLREPCSRWFSPPVVVLKVDVVELRVRLRCFVALIESLGDVALFIKVLRSHLGNMQVDEVGVVCVDVHHLVFIVSINVNGILNREMLMRQDHIWMAMLIAWGCHVEQLQIPVFLLLVDLEEEVFLRDYLVVGLSSKSFSRDLVLEFD